MECAVSYVEMLSHLATKSLLSDIRLTNRYLSCVEHTLRTEFIKQIILHCIHIYIYIYIYMYIYIYIYIYNIYITCICHLVYFTITLHIFYNIQNNYIYYRNNIRKPFLIIFFTQIEYINI